jgi:hypothetical protein
VIRIGLIAVLLGFLLGCSPEYNWRDVSVGDGAVKATFPDKPVTEMRKLPFAGHDVEFSVTATTVKGATFAVGYAPIPAAIRGDEKARNAMAEQVIQSFYRNLGVAPPSTLPALGTSFVIRGRSPKGEIELQAMVRLTPFALVEGVVTAKSQAYPQDQAAEFLRSIVVAR